MKRLTNNPILHSIAAAIFCCFSLISSAQLYVPSGASLHMTGNALLMSGSNVINEGTINAGTGTIEMQGNLTNSGTLDASAATLKFSGYITQQVNMGPGTSIKNMIINKSENDVVVSGILPPITGSLGLEYGRLDIGANNLTVNEILSYSIHSYVKTSGNGKLIQNVPQSASVMFPVGNSSLNSVLITNNSIAADTYSARVTDEVYDGGFTGSVITRERIKRTWDINKTNPNSGNGADFVFSYASADATAALTNPVMNHYSNGYWRPQYGLYSVSPAPGGLFAYLGYKGAFSPFSVQEFYNSTLTGKAFIQGYYQGSQTMNAALANSGIAGATLSQADSITVSLHNAENGEQVGNEIVTVLNTNGNFNAQMQGVAGPHYIAIRHRNSIETWSANPVIFNDNATYDFSTAASQAFGDNQINVGGGVYAIYSGDLNQDGAVESSDYAEMENEVLRILFGYYSADITGDGAIESDDYGLIENNVLRIIFAATPF